MHKNSVIIICGPTAVGKTAVAVKLALKLQTEIISADSRQCFKELNIGVAKPSPDELGSAHHYFINSHSIHEEVNAGVFEKYALDAAAKIFTKHTVAVMVGGTGLYIKAFAEGMDEMPQVNAAIRQQLMRDYQQKGLEWLQQQVAKLNPEFWAVAEQQNPQRLLRGLEVLLSSGKSITTFRSAKKEDRPFNILKIGLEIHREELYEQINCRVDKMIEEGLVNEVAALSEQRNINALQTVGYRELFDFFDEKVSLQQAIINIKTNTRHYAKRQLTWFKKDESTYWFNPYDPDLIYSVVEKVKLYS